MMHARRREGRYQVSDPDLFNLPFASEEFRSMTYRRLGHSGLQASAIGIGTWKFGDPASGDGSRVGGEAAQQLLDCAYDLGVTFWDTAGRYNNASGNSERVLGQWIDRNRRVRRDIVIATKVFPLMDGLTPNHYGTSRTNVIESVYASLDRLRTDYVDVLYLHMWDESSDIEEALCAVDDLVRADLVRYMGVSNFSAEQISRLLEVTQHGEFSRCRPAVVQNQFDILRGELGEFGGKGVLELCAATPPSFVAWSPLAGGLISDRYLDPALASSGDRLVDEGRLDALCTSEHIRKLRRLGELANEVDVGITELALAFMLAIDGMGPVIAAVSSRDQLRANASAAKLCLSRAQLSAIAEAAGFEGPIADNNGDCWENR